MTISCCLDVSQSNFAISLCVLLKLGSQPNFYCVLLLQLRCCEEANLACHFLEDMLFKNCKLTFAKYQKDPENNNIGK